MIIDFYLSKAKLSNKLFGINSKISPLVSGLFVSADEKWVLNVSQINFNEFISCNHINVVKDTNVSDDKYFLFELYYIKEDGSCVYCDFVNLKCSSGDKAGAFNYYEDDYGNTIQPFTWKTCLDKKYKITHTQNAENENNFLYKEKKI